MNHARPRLLPRVCPVLLLLAACSDEGASKANDTRDFTGAYDHLQGALGECANKASECAQDAEDDESGLQSCRTQEASCRQRAGDDASDELAAAIQTCIDAAKRCAGDGGVSHVDGACKDTLESCLEVHPGTDDDDDDGGSVDGSQSPVRVCVEDLRACVIAERSATQCADQVSACVVASAPGHDPGTGGMPADAGMSGDSHEPPADAGMSGASHPPPADAGMSGTSHPPPADAGSDGSHEPPEDAGMPTKDSCQNAYDACLKANGSRPVCSRMLRECEKDNAQ